MKIIKRAVCVLFCITVAVSSLTFCNADEATEDTVTVEKLHRTAGVCFDNGKEEKNNVNVSLMNFVVGSDDGRSAYLGTSGSSNDNIFINIDDSYWYSDEPQRVKVEVEYKDIKGGSFSVHYNSAKYGNQAYPKEVMTTGSNEWKTYTFYVDDFIANNKCFDANCDIRIRSGAWNINTSKQDIIRNITITENVTEQKLEVEASNGYAGRIFDYKGNDEMTLTFTNFYDKELNNDISYYIESVEGKKMAEESISSFSLRPGESIDKVIHTTVSDICDVYHMYVTVKNEVEEYTREFDFSVARTLGENDVAMPSLAMNVHLEQPVYGGDDAIEIMSRFGVSSYRLEGKWNNVEPVAGAYQEPYREIADKLDAVGIDTLVAFTAGNKLYNGGRGDAYYSGSDQEIEAYGKGAGYIAGNWKNANYIELFNEFNHPGFNASGLKYDTYTKFLKSAYKEAKVANPDIKIVAGGMAGFDFADLKVIAENGGFDYCDALSYHPYQGNKGSMDSLRMQGRQVRELMSDYDKDLDIIITEFGYSDAVNDSTDSSIKHEDKDFYAPAYYITAISEDAADMIYWYELGRTGMQESMREHNWHLIDHSMRPHNSLVANETFITMAAMSNLIQDSEPARKAVSDDLTYAYEFNCKDGGQIAAIYNETYRGHIALNLGCDEVTLYNMKGTEIGNIKGVNGVYSFDLSDEIMYIKGNFENFETTDTVIGQNELKYNVLKGNSIKISLDDTLGRNLKLKADYNPEVFTPVSESNNELVFETSDDAVGLYHINVCAYDENDELCYFGTDYISITNLAIDFSYTTSQVGEESDRRWCVYVNVTNLSDKNKIAGKCYVTAPEKFKGAQTEFKCIDPREERMLKLNLPELVDKLPEEISVTVELSGGEKFVKNQKLDFTTAAFAEKKPKIDGIYEKDLWSKATLLAENRADKFYCSNGVPWGGKNDLSYTFRMLWDEDNLYMYVTVKDNIFNNQEQASRIWAADSVQFGIMKSKNMGIDDTSSTFTEIGYGKLNDGVKMWRYSSCGDGKIGEVTNFDAAVIRKSGETVYEARIPWVELFGNGHKAQKGDEYAFSMLVNDSDGQVAGKTDNRHGFMNYNDGVGTVKDSKLFGKLTLR